MESQVAELNENFKKTEESLLEKIGDHVSSNVQISSELVAVKNDYQVLSLENQKLNAILSLRNEQIGGITKIFDEMRDVMTDNLAAFGINVIQDGHEETRKSLGKKFSSMSIILDKQCDSRLNLRNERKIVIFFL